MTQLDSEATCSSAGSYLTILNLHLTKYSKQSIHKPSGKHTILSLAFKDFFYSFLFFAFCTKGALTSGKAS